MWKAVGILLVICYILWRWILNFCIRFYVWLPYLSICLILFVSIIGIKFLPRVAEIFADIDNFFGEHFAVNPMNFSSVQYLKELCETPSYSRSSLDDLISRESPPVSTPEPIVSSPVKPSISLDALKNRIQDIAGNSGI